MFPNLDAKSVILFCLVFANHAEPGESQPGRGRPSGIGAPSGSGTKGSGTTGSSSQNPHVTDWGDYAICEAPPTGFCADYTITEAKVLDSLSGFTTYNGRTLAQTSFNYFGDWWQTNVGTNAEVAENFCDDGEPGAGGGTSTVETYSGVTFEATDSEYTLSSEGIPTGDLENYCSVVGSKTPPLLGTTFGETYSQSFTFSPSTKSRESISNSVGWAVDGVVIYSPYTGISTVAPYDESLDTCIGHPADGRYHYHGFSPCIHGESGTQSGDSIPHSKIYGWAFDGFPIYGPYGYTDGNDINSSVVRVTSGYKCTVDEDECSEEEKTDPDYWVSDSTGMLDECNGRWTRTPEFPDGMYVYVLNIQENGLPEFPGVPYCLHGEATGSFSETIEELMNEISKNGEKINALIAEMGGK